MSYPIWVTKSGEKIRINKMSDSHLANTLRMLKRGAEHKRVREISLMREGYMMLQGEMATYYAEQEMDAAEKSSWKDWTPRIFRRMEELAEKRGIRWDE